MTNLISIIIPVYNAERYLQRCLDSVLGQTLKEIEVICINDGSTDGSAAILSEYAAKDARIQVVWQKNAGQGMARNRGMELAQGEYIYFIDADDELGNDEALARLAAEMDCEQLDVLFFDAETKLEDGVKFHNGAIRMTNYIRTHNYLGVHTGQELLVAFRKFHEYSVSPCLIMLRKSFLKANHLSFPAANIFYEDNIFMVHIMLLAKRVGHRPWRFYIRSVHDGSTITTVPSLRHLRGYLACYLDIKTIISQNNFARTIRRFLKDQQRCYALNFVKLARRMNLRDDDLYRDMTNNEQAACKQLLKWSPLKRILVAALCCYYDNGFLYTLRRILFGKRQ